MLQPCLTPEQTMTPAERCSVIDLNHTMRSDTKAAFLEEHLFVKVPNVSIQREMDCI